MSLMTVIAGIFKASGAFIVNIITFIASIEYFFGKNIPPLLRIFRIIGFFAFTSIFFQAAVAGLAKVKKPDTITPEYVAKSTLSIFGEFFTIFVGVDNAVLTASKEFVDIEMPVLWDAIKTFFRVMSRSYFYIWWFRIFEWLFRETGLLFGFDKSTGDIKVFTKVFTVLTIFIILTNIGSMIYWQQIDFATPENLNLAQKIRHFFDTNFQSAFHFLLVFVPYKGILHYMIFSLGTSIYLLINGIAQTFNPGKPPDIILENISMNIT